MTAVTITNLRNSILKKMKRLAMLNGVISTLFSNKLEQSNCNHNNSSRLYRLTYMLTLCTISIFMIFLESIAVYRYRFINTVPVSSSRQLSIFTSQYQNLSCIDTYNLLRRYCMK